MIPYFKLPALRILGQPIQPFTWFVSVGLVVAYLLGQRRVKSVGLYEPLGSVGFLWVYIGGLFGAHILEVVAYYPERLLENPFTLLAVWEGFSSFGGFIGGTIALYVHCHRHGVGLLTYCDPMMYGFVPGWIIARCGCFVSHDHLGTASDFVLAVAYEGGPRHNLGLYEMLWAVVMTVVIYALPHRKRFVGFYTSLVLLLYAPARFLMDFLRTGERRYLGLTPAQYLCGVMVVIAVVLILRGRGGHSAHQEQR